jgi:hypothetical protein
MCQINTLRTFRWRHLLVKPEKTYAYTWYITLYRLIPIPLLWSSGLSSLLEIQRSRVDSGRYQTFWEVVGLKRGPLSLVSTTEELPGRNSSGSGLENREYGRGDPLRWPRDTFYPQKLALTSPISGGRSVGIVRLLIKATEFFVLYMLIRRWWFLLISGSDNNARALRNLRWQFQGTWNKFQGQNFKQKF